MAFSHRSPTKPEVRQLRGLSDVRLGYLGPVAVFVAALAHRFGTSCLAPDTLAWTATIMGFVGFLAASQRDGARTPA